jgi:hypothetical protein
MIKFRQVGKQTDLNAPKCLKEVRIPLGETWHFLINKSVLGCDCNPKVAIIAPYKNIGECVFQENVLEKYSCIEKIENDGKAYINLIIKDINDIPNFTISVDGEDIFDFISSEAEISDYDELLLYTESLGYGYEITNYGIRLYFDKRYTNRKATISTDRIYFLHDTFCLYKSDVYRLSICFRQVGNYQIVILDEDDIISVSDPIIVTAYIDKKTSMIEYVDKGFFNRYRIPLRTFGDEILVDESEGVLSNGTISISNTILRPQKSFETQYLEISEHLELAQILKKGCKLDFKKCFLRGEYVLGEGNNSRKTLATGTLNFPDEEIKNTADCSMTCTSTSSFKYHIQEYFEYKPISPPLGLGISERYIVDEFLKHSGFTCDLSFVVDLGEPIEVTRGGLRRQSDEYSIAGSVLTFVEEFGSPVGGEPSNVESIIVSYYRVV